MANIEELQRALRQGSDAKARLSGLDEQYQQAQDRGVATTKKDQYGQVSPLSVLADVVGQSRSRRDMRELAPQREAARSNIAQHENAQGLFNAVRQQEQDSQIQANWTDGHALKLAQQRQSEAREVSRQEELAAELALNAQNTKYDRGVDEAREVSRQEELAAELALNAKNTEYDRGLNVSNQNQAAWLAKQKNNAEGMARQSVVELVSTTDPEDRLDVYERDGKYYDPQTDEQIDSAGYKAVQKTSSRTGYASRYTEQSKDDEFGNKVLWQFNKETGERTDPVFVDRTAYSLEEAKKRGGRAADQKGNEKRSQVSAQNDENAAESAYKESFAIKGTMQEMDKALDALINKKADSGPIAQYLPNIREGAVLLKAAQDQMALYEIGKYTFGSLSEAEGNWLKDVVIPTGLNENKLIPWLQRKREGMARMMKVKSHEQKLRKLGLTPTQEEIDKILYHGGFSFSDG
jgi:hypothetical protein